MVEKINHSESSSWDVSFNRADFSRKYPISHARLVLTPLGDTNQVLICQSTLPSHLLKSSMVSCGTDSRKCQLVNGKAFYLLSSLVHNVFNFANFFDWVNEKLYKDQFHIFSFYKQQMGLISISGLKISNLSLFCFIIDHNVRMIEYADQKDQGKK